MKTAIAALTLLAGGTRDKEMVDGRSVCGQSCFCFVYMHVRVSIHFLLQEASVGSCSPPLLGSSASHKGVQLPSTDMASWECHQPSISWYVCLGDVRDQTDR